MSLGQDVIAIAVQTGLATFVTGPPGSGKTLWTRALGKALGRHVVTHICALHPPEDYAGIPAPNFEARHAPLLPVGDLKPTLEAHPDAIVLLDDVSWATPATQAALLRLPFERVMGDWAMPSTCTFILCKNTTEQAGGGYEIIPPLANRGLHITWDAGNVQTWINGQLAGWPPPVVPHVPAKWRDHLMTAHALIGGYLAHQPHKLHVEPKTPEDGSGPWPSRRSTCSLTRRNIWQSMRRWDLSRQSSPRGDARRRCRTRNTDCCIPTTTRCRRAATSSMRR